MRKTTKQEYRLRTPFIIAPRSTTSLRYLSPLTRPAPPGITFYKGLRLEGRLRRLRSTKMSPSTTTQLEIPPPSLSPLPLPISLVRERDQSPGVASGSRTPRPKTLTPSPPVSRRHSMVEGEGESDMGVLLRTIDFAARVSLPCRSDPGAGSRACVQTWSQWWSHRDDKEG